ncbi:hypothetical protein [Mycobacterium sp. 852002-51163_SCH5372311]|uniref:hypothetical protein n=1 Tax=Mycobacterium sp. 852002-51163_SCH5372311 TaxID=1834097 RepID=UPI000ACCC0D5|nr:hypothetical protein [Mycobacterium sp. 852002-51163_SCH5372311]
MSTEPSPVDAGSPPITSPCTGLSEGTFKHDPEVWWLLGSQLFVVVLLVVLLVV